MALVRVRCVECAKRFDREAGQINRRRRIGAPLYCSQKCFGLAHRVSRSAAEWKRIKAEYDREYRAKNRRLLKRKKQAYHREHYDAEAARQQRAKRMPWHVAYCREYYKDPKKKAAKVRYDLERRSAEYGAYAEAHKILVRLQKLIRQKSPDKYQRAIDRGYYDRQRERSNLRRRTRNAESR